MHAVHKLSLTFDDVPLLQRRQVVKPPLMMLTQALYTVWNCCSSRNACLGLRFLSSASSDYGLGPETSMHKQLLDNILGISSLLDARYQWRFPSH